MFFPQLFFLGFMMSWFAFTFLSCSSNEVSNRTTLFYDVQIFPCCFTLTQAFFLIKLGWGVLKEDYAEYEVVFIAQGGTERVSKLETRAKGLSQTDVDKGDVTTAIQPRGSPLRRNWAKQHTSN